MTGKVEFYRHQLGEDEASSWRQVIDTLFLTLGPQVAAFEQELGRYLVRDRANATAPHVVGTNACSMGLLIALRALDVGPGDEVITTPMTFAATANAILHLGATPRFVDVEPATGLIDPAAVAAAVGPKTVGILPVHLYGQLADMRALRAIADRHSLFVVEDSAHGVEMERDGVRPGDLSEAAVFSFYATKNLTCGDGGAVATRDQRTADRLRRLRNHGVSKGAAERHGALYQHWDLAELGYKANLTDLDAALLRPQIPHLDAKRGLRERVAVRYETGLRERVADLRSAPAAGPGGQAIPWLVERRGQSTHHLFTLHTRPGHRDELLSKLGADGIGTAVNYRAIHLLTYLKDSLGIPRGSLPVAEEIGDRTISLPMYPTLGVDEQDRVIEAVARAW
jgi:dTDP-4-amino-4,6-dideoxygalactose transaminase